jgi:uncharacterized protein YraI
MMQEGNASRVYAATFALGMVFGMVAGVSLALAALATAQVTGDRRHVLVATATPAPTQEPTATPDARPRTVAVAGVHMGPGHDFGVLGTVGKGQALEVVGRNAGATWLAISFPPGSNAIGWVELNVVGGLADPGLLAVVQTTPMPRSTPVATRP